MTVVIYDPRGRSAEYWQETLQRPIEDADAEVIEVEVQ